MAACHIIGPFICLFVFSSLKKIQFQLRLWFTPLGFHCLRLGERFLPQSVLSFLLWPPAAVWSLIELRRQFKALEAWRNCPAPWRPDRRKFLRRQALGWTHSRFIYIWGDRLLAPHWRKRCRVEANYDLEALQQSDRPIIFTSLHYGPFETLPLWLRAQGIAATALVGRPVHPRRARFHARVAPGGVPLTMPVDEMGPIRKSLGPGRRLLIWMDVDRGRQIDVPYDGLSVHLASGAIRLAAITGAELIPCLISEEGTWNFVLHFGAPVPQEYLGRLPNVMAAAMHLLQESLRIVAQDPSQCGFRLLSRITQRTEKPVPAVLN